MRTLDFTVDNALIADIGEIHCFRYNDWHADKYKWINIIECGQMNISDVGRYDRMLDIALNDWPTTKIYSV